MRYLGVPCDDLSTNLRGPSLLTDLLLIGILSWPQRRACRWVRVRRNSLGGITSEYSSEHWRDTLGLGVVAVPTMRPPTIFTPGGCPCFAYNRSINSASFLGLSC